MKNFTTLLTVAIILIITQSLNAQQEITVKNEKINMSKGEQSAYIVEIPQAEYDNVLKSWSKTIRQNTKSKVDKGDHEVVIMETNIEEIYPTPINVYSSLIKSDSAIKLLAVFEMDSIIVFNYNESEKSVQDEKVHSHIKQFVRNFAVEEYQKAVEEELKVEEKKLKKLNKDLGDLLKQNENHHKDIKENEQKISHSEDAISSYEIDRERKLGEINTAKETIASVGDNPELLEQARDQLKALEKEKKGISNKLEKENKSIVKSQSNIDQLNNDIEKNLQSQQLTKDMIVDQEGQVQAVKVKLSGIK